MTRIVAMAAALMLAAGGSQALADEKNEHVPYDQVPAKVREAFERDFPGAKVEEVEKETDDGRVHYEIEFRGADGGERDVEYSPEGKRLDDGHGAHGKPDKGKH